MRLRTIAVTSFLMLSAAKAEGQGIVEILSRPHYRAAYDAMIGRSRVPPWMATAKAVLEGEGPGDAGTRTKIAGENVEAFWFCKRHDCGEQHAAIIFLRHGDFAKSVYRFNGKLTFLGSPNAAERKVLLSLLSQS